MNQNDRPKKPQKKTGSPQPIPGRCGAKLTFTDPPLYCMRWPNKGRNRCKNHGGDSLVGGPTHPTYKHGRHSKYIKSPEILARFNSALEDPDLLSIKRGVAIADVRWSMLLERFSSGESGQHWKLLKKAWEGFQDTNKKIQAALKDQADELARPPDERSEARLAKIDERISSNRKKASDLLNAIGKHIIDGAAEQDQFREILNLSHEMASLQRAESSRLAETGQKLDVGQAVSLVAALLDSIARRVTDNKLKQDIAADIMRIANAPGMGMPKMAPAVAAAEMPAVIEETKPVISGAPQVIDGTAKPAT